MKALVVGGAGPTGPLIVEGLRQRGYRVSVLNRGVHPVDAPGDVERIVGDPHFLKPLQAAIGERRFDLVIASYGRLALVAEALAGRTDRFIGVGGGRARLSRRAETCRTDPAAQDGSRRGAAGHRG